MVLGDMTTGQLGQLRRARGQSAIDPVVANKMGMLNQQQGVAGSAVAAPTPAPAAAPASAIQQALARGQSQTNLGGKTGGAASSGKVGSPAPAVPAPAVPAPAAPAPAVRATAAAPIGSPQWVQDQFGETLANPEYRAELEAAARARRGAHLTGLDKLYFDAYGVAPGALGVRTGNVPFRTAGWINPGYHPTRNVSGYRRFNARDQFGSGLEQAFDEKAGADIYRAYSQRPSWVAHDQGQIAAGVLRELGVTPQTASDWDKFLAMDAAFRGAQLQNQRPPRRFGLGKMLTSVWNPEDIIKNLTQAGIRGLANQAAKQIFLG